METVRFITEDETTSKDMSADFGCILAHKEIGAPGVKTDFFNVPFRNGSINAYSLVTSEPVYDNREIKLDFIYLNGGDHNILINSIYEFVHGRELWVQFSDDIGYVYKSHVTSIDNVVMTNQCLKFSINCTCHPYKFDRMSTLVDWLWDELDLVNGIINEVGELEIAAKATAKFTLVCRKKKAYPTITSDGEFRLNIPGKSFTVYPAGVNKIYDVGLVEGENNVQIYNPTSSTIKVTFEYRGESL